MTRQEAAKICQSIKFMMDKEDYSEEVEEALDMAIEALEQPKIVHCKDCVKWCKGDDLYGICNWNEYRTLRTTKDSFCSYGRRESETK